MGLKLEKAVLIYTFFFFFYYLQCTEFYIGLDSALAMSINMYFKLPGKS